VATAATQFAPGVSRDPSSFPGAFAYEHADVPPGWTLGEYRRELATANRNRGGRVSQFIRALAALAALAAGAGR
jgi:hypothetical protein